MPFKDPEAKKRHNQEYYAEYRLLKAAQIKSRQSKWYVENKEKLADKQRERGHAKQRIMAATTLDALAGSQKVITPRKRRRSGDVAEA